MSLSQWSPQLLHSQRQSRNRKSSDKETQKKKINESEYYSQIVNDTNSKQESQNTKGSKFEESYLTQKHCLEDRSKNKSKEKKLYDSLISNGSSASKEQRVSARQRSMNMVPQTQENKQPISLQSQLQNSNWFLKKALMSYQLFTQLFQELSSVSEDKQKQQQTIGEISFQLSLLVSQEQILALQNQIFQNNEAIISESSQKFEKKLDFQKMNKRFSTIATQTENAWTEESFEPLKRQYKTLKQENESLRKQHEKTQSEFERIERSVAQKQLDSENYRQLFQKGEIEKINLENKVENMILKIQFLKGILKSQLAKGQEQDYSKEMQFKLLEVISEILDQQEVQNCISTISAGEHYGELVGQLQTELVEQKEAIKEHKQRLSYTNLQLLKSLKHQVKSIKVLRRIQRAFIEWQDDSQIFFDTYQSIQEQNLLFIKKLEHKSALIKKHVSEIEAQIDAQNQEAEMQLDESLSVIGTPIAMKGKNMKIPILDLSGIDQDFEVKVPMMKKKRANLSLCSERQFNRRKMKIDVQCVDEQAISQRNAIQFEQSEISVSPRNQMKIQDNQYLTLEMGDILQLMNLQAKSVEFQIEESIN